MHGAIKGMPSSDEKENENKWWQRIWSTKKGFTETNHRIWSAKAKKEA
jgi:hypothetical protein